MKNLNLKTEAAISIQQRINEIEECLNNNLYLSAIFLCGSALEGLLMEMALNHMREYNSAKATPKDQSGKALLYSEWKLHNFIEVSYEIGILIYFMKW